MRIGKTAKELPVKELMERVKKSRLSVLDKMPVVHVNDLNSEAEFLKHSQHGLSPNIIRSRKRSLIAAHKK